jgi:hypothetical protein
MNFNTSLLKNYPTIYIVGPKKIGKSELVVNLINILNYNSVTVCCNNWILEECLYNKKTNAKIVGDPLDALKSNSDLTVLEEYRSPDLENILSRCKKSLIITSQCDNLSPKLRSLTDFVFVFRQNHRRKNIYNNYFGNISFNEFNESMDSLQPYECLVSDQRTGNISKYNSRNFIFSNL